MQRPRQITPRFARIDLRVMRRLELSKKYMKRISIPIKPEIAILLLGYSAAVVVGFVGSHRAGYTVWQSVSGAVKAPWCFLWWPSPFLLFVALPMVLFCLLPLSRRHWWLLLRRVLLILLAIGWTLWCGALVSQLKKLQPGGGGYGSPETSSPSPRR